MIIAVADTHAVVWYLANDPRLGDEAKKFSPQSYPTPDVQNVRLHKVVRPLKGRLKTVLMIRISL